MIWLIASQGAYTDGILQITAFKNGLTYWPPLYTALSYFFAWVPGVGLEGSARFISVVSGSVAVLPIWAIAKRLFGQRASVMAMILYTLSPIPLRWSEQVMTDALFMALWMGCLAVAMIATHKIWPELFEQTGEKAKPDPPGGFKWLLIASFLGALATLTRYQGAFLLPVLVAIALRFRNAKDESKPTPPYVPEVTLAPWVLFPLWLLLAKLISAQTDGQGIAKHGKQIAERMGQNWVETAVNYWYVFEQFVLCSPYFITYGIFGFFLYGLFRIKYSTRRILTSTVAAGSLTLAILLLQAAFQAFQCRYILPIVPFVIIAAGHGMAVWERHCEKHPWRFWSLAIPTFAYALIFSSLVALYQGGPFLDLKKAGQWIRENAPADARVVTTEHYNEDIGAPKLSFWSGGRKVEPFVSQDLQPGDYIVLPSFYGAAGIKISEQFGLGGLNEANTLADILLQKEYAKAARDAISQYPAQLAQVFRYSTFPLLPDIMEEPMLTHTNPLSWYLRYHRQYFQTAVLKVVTFEEADKADQKRKPSQAQPAAAPLLGESPPPTEGTP